MQNKTEITLSEDQEFALETIIDRFTSCSRATYFLLQGEAGTGKTTIMRELKHHFTPIIYATPTNSASSVLEDKVEQETFTIHKILGLSPGLDLVDFDPLDPKFVQRNPMDKDELDRAKLLVIDECSMINDKLLNYLMKLYIPILFVGDIEQIKPVKNKSVSKVFEFPFVELTTVHRQKKDSEAYVIAKKARQKDYSFIEDAIFYEEDVEEYIKERKLTVLAYHNTTVNQWSEKVRKLLVPEAYFPNGKVKNKLLVGENILIREDNRDLGLKNNMIFQVQELTPKVSLSKDGESVHYKELVIYNEKIGTKKVRLLSPISYDYYSKVLGGIYFKCKERTLSWARYYEVKNYFIVQDDIYYNDVKISKRDFQHTYAMTTHKAQGATIEDVLIDFADILKCRDKQLKTQLITVACSSF